MALVRSLAAMRRLSDDEVQALDRRGFSFSSTHTDGCYAMPCRSMRRGHVSLTLRLWHPRPGSLQIRFCNSAALAVRTPVAADSSFLLELTAFSGARDWSASFNGPDTALVPQTRRCPHNSARWDAPSAAEDITVIFDAPAMRCTLRRGSVEVSFDIPPQFSDLASSVCQVAIGTASPHVVRVENVKIM